MSDLGILGRSRKRIKTGAGTGTLTNSPNPPRKPLEGGFLFFRELVLIGSLPTDPFAEFVNVLDMIARHHGVPFSLNKA